MDYKFTFSEEEANLILNALAELPYKATSGIIRKIQTQASEQPRIVESAQNTEQGDKKSE